MEKIGKARKTRKLSDTYVWHIKSREKRSAEEAAYISGVVRLFEKRLKERYISLLDMPCGNGRLHPFLRKTGFQVFGVDISRELIAAARKRFQKFRSFYKVADMRNFTSEKKFDVALSWFTSFGYYSDSENLKILKNISRSLRKGGLLLMDIPNAKHSARRGSWSWTRNYGSIVEIDYSDVSRVAGRTVCMLRERFYVKEGRDFELSQEVRKKIMLYSSSEIRELASRAGFRVMEIFSSQTFDRMDENTSQMLVVCRKI